MIKTDDYLREFMTILFAQKSTIVTVTSLFLVVGLLIAFLWPPTYGANSAVLVKGRKIEKNPEAIEEAQYRVFEVDETFLNSEAAIVTSTDVLGMTIKSLDEQGTHYGNPDETINKRVDELKKYVRAEIIPKSNIIEVILLDKDPDKALLLLQSLLDHYIQFRSDIYSPSKTEAFFQSQVERFSRDIAQKETELEEFYKEFGSVDPTNEIDSNLELINKLQEQLNLEHNALIKKNHDIAFLQHGVASEDVQFFASFEQLSMVKLSEQLQLLTIERGRILRNYLPGSDAVELVTGQINQTYQALRAEVRELLRREEQEQSAIEENIASLQARIKAISDRNIYLKSTSIRMDRLEMELGVLKSSYTTFATRLQEARVNSSTLQEGLISVSVIKQPFYSGEPLFPKKIVVIPLGLIIGLIMGISLGFINEYFDHSFKRPEDSERFAGIPTIMSIPKWNA